MVNRSISQHHLFGSLVACQLSNSYIPCSIQDLSAFYIVPNIVQKEKGIKACDFDVYYCCSLVISWIHDHLTLRVPGVAVPCSRLHADVTAHMRMFGFSGFCVGGELFMSSALCTGRGRSALRSDVRSVFVMICRPEKRQDGRHER